MGVDYLYCGKCEECDHEDYFRHCDMCDELFYADCCGHLCDNCDESAKKKVTFEGKEYFLYLHDSCHKDWYKRTKLAEQTEIIDEHGKLVNPEAEKSQ